MARLTILVHRGCISIDSIQKLTQEIRQQLPDWTIELLPAEVSGESVGLIVLPAFFVDETLVATGLPETEWLLRRLLEHE